MAEIVFVKIWKRLLLCKISDKLRAWESRHSFCTFLLPMHQNKLLLNLETRIVIILEGALNLRFEKQHFFVACVYVWVGGVWDHFDVRGLASSQEHVTLHGTAFGLVKPELLFVCM